MKTKQLLKLAVALLVTSALSGCNLARLAGINAGGIGTVTTVSPQLLALHTANYKGAGSLRSEFKNAAGTSIEPQGTKALAVDLAADFDAAVVSGTAKFTAGDNNITNTLVLNQTSINGTSFAGTTTVLAPSITNPLTSQSGQYGGAFAGDGSTVAGTGSGVVAFTDANRGLITGTYDFDFNANKTAVVVVDPATAVRVATMGDFVQQDFPGKSYSDIRADLTTELLSEGATQAEVDRFLAFFTETTQAVWYDNADREVGPLYFDPKTNSIIPNNRDGDPSNDTGVAYNPKGLSPKCSGHCTGLGSLAVVSADLVAKHLATYAGNGEIKVDVFGSVEQSYTAATTDTLTANFDNGTIGGTSVHKEGGVATGDTVSVQLYNGIIAGREFNGEMSIVDNPGGSVIDQEGGRFSGQFSESGTSASATGQGLTGGTIPGGGNWEGAYELRFNVAQR